MTNLKKGYFIAVSATFFLGTTAIFIGYLTRIQQVAPLVVAWWRDILVCAILGPVLFFIRRSLLRTERKNLWFFISFGLVMAVFNAVWTLSVQLNGAAVATVLAYGSTGFTALLGRWLFKERLDLAKIMAVVLSLGGCILVSKAYDPGVWNINPMGILFGVGTALLYAIYSLMGKESSRRGINSWASLFFAFGLAAVFLVVINFIPGIPGSAGTLAGLFPKMTSTAWQLMIGLALVSVVGFGLYILAMNYLQASVTNLIATLEPVLTAVLAYILLNERMAMLQGLGGVLIVLSLVILRLSEQETLKAQPN